MPIPSRLLRCRRLGIDMDLPKDPGVFTLHIARMPYQLYSGRDFRTPPKNNELNLCQKNPRAHHNKIGTPPPQTENPPPKTRILWTWRFSCRKSAEILGVHKIGAAISGPRIADTNFTDMRIFLTLVAQMARFGPRF